MARLTIEQWSEMRDEWQASPRQGIAWLTAAAGGRWTVTEEAIRRRRLAEDWAKPVDMASVVRRARVAADQLEANRQAARRDDPSTDDTAALDDAMAAVTAPMVAVVPRLVGSGADKNQSHDDTAPSAADQAVDMRTKLIDLHRQEWRAARKLAWDGMREAEKATGFDKAKFAKITTETLRNIQEGERRAWGLDADLIDFDSLTDAQLEALAKGKTVR